MSEGTQKEPVVEPKAKELSPEELSQVNGGRSTTPLSEQIQEIMVIAASTAPFAAQNSTKK